MKLQVKKVAVGMCHGGRVLALSRAGMLALSLFPVACGGVFDGPETPTSEAVTPSGSEASSTNANATGGNVAAITSALRRRRHWGHNMPGSTGGSNGGGGSAPVGTGGSAPDSTGGSAPVSTGGSAPVSTGGSPSTDTGGATSAGTGGATLVSTGGQAGSTTTPPPGTSPDAFLGGFFPIAVDGPRPTDFQGSTDCSTTPARGNYAGWSNCGINTIVRGPDCSDDSCPATFDALVTAAGLHMIRAPLPDAAQDIAKHKDDHLLLAWAQMDEPDANGNLSQHMSALSSRYASLIALPGHPPIYTNMGGSDLMVTGQAYQQAFTYTDWTANDIYPVSGWLDERFTRGDLTLVGKALAQMDAFAPGKPRFAWIEANDILGKGDPTPAEVRAEIWIAIVAGARGIFYFQEQVEPNFDLLSTTGAVRTEMGKQHNTITQLAGVLQGPIDPSNMGAAAPAPLMIGWRQAASGRYIIVVNTSGSTVSGASVTLTGLTGAQAASVWDESRMVSISNGSLTDDFAPYARHIYVVP
ncbi:MAG: hypothetical protein ABJA82_11920 [Myxococcales bacterium]